MSVATIESPSRSGDLTSVKRSEPQTAKFGDVHVGIFLYPTRREGLKEFSIKYYILMGNKENFKTNVHTAELVTLKRVPDVWNRELREHLEIIDGPFVKVGPLRNIGSIEYVVPAEFSEDGTVAVSHNYNPRHALGRKVASKIPYFLEAMTTKDLERRGYTHICTSMHPHWRRVDQLERIGLEPYVPKPIEIWLRALGYGVAEQLKT
jgi:hypothetical protein